MVPSTHQLARTARALMRRLGIDVNDAVNGSRLTKDKHQKSGLHADDAILEVVGRIILLDNLPARLTSSLMGSCCVGAWSTTSCNTTYHQ
ncbi:MAG: hypothetical protein F6K32_27300 [Desertifilum sp. SIO1I2]|nr:hypothetical protein [Desertifilum sp. SIO1I2]